MNLEKLGWNSNYEAAWSRQDRGSHVPARVVEVHKNAWRVRSEGGEFLARLAGRLRRRLVKPQDWPAVGDWVEAAADLIFDVLPRQTRLSRKAAGRRTEEQIVAANLDTVFLVTSLDGDFNPRRVERYLTVAWEGGAQPVVLLNKADLCDDALRFRIEMERAAPGVPVFAVSARDGTGLDQLEPHLRSGRTVALVGSSGVGKSTLINRLCGFDRQAVRDVLADGRGRHTTTYRSLIALSSGALLIDTPGMRELQLWATEESLDNTFEEIERLAGHCRFRDCAHVTEPGCAVRRALEAGEISQDRYESLLKLRKELAFIDRKRDVLAELENKRKWKAIHRAHRSRQSKFS